MFDEDGKNYGEWIRTSSGFSFIHFKMLKAGEYLLNLKPKGPNIDEIPEPMPFAVVTYGLK